MTVMYTLLETESGLELKLKTKETYAFSYMNYDLNGKINHHVRVDLIENLLKTDLGTED